MQTSKLHSFLQPLLFFMGTYMTYSFSLFSLQLPILSSSLSPHRFLKLTWKELKTHSLARNLRDLIIFSKLVAFIAKSLPIMYVLSIPDIYIYILV